MPLQNIGPVFITSVKHFKIQLEDRNGTPGLHQDKGTFQYWTLEPVPTPDSLASGTPEHIPGAYYLLSHRTKRLEQKEGFLYGKFLDMRDVTPIQTTTRWILSDAGNNRFFLTSSLNKQLGIKGRELATTKHKRESEMFMITEVLGGKELTCDDLGLKSTYDPLEAAFNNAEEALMEDEEAEEIYVAEEIKDVTLHKLVNDAWDVVEPNPARVSFMYNGVEKMFYAVAQTSDEAVVFRTYITEDTKEHYQAQESMYHTWWVPDEASDDLQAWSLNFNTAEDAARLHATIISAVEGTLPTQSEIQKEEVREEVAEATEELQSEVETEQVKKIVAEEGQSAVPETDAKVEFMAMRRKLFEDFRKDIACTKVDIVAALQLGDKNGIE